MPLNKKLIAISIFFFVSTSFLSGCILQDLIFGTSFELTSSDITNSEGFPVLELFFKASNKVTLKTYNSENELMDTNFFYGDSNTTLNIGNYRENIGPDVCKLKVYDDENNMINEQKFSFSGPDILIVSCKQRWWENEEGYHLVGLEVLLTNDGDTPFYPHSLKLISGSETLEALILPEKILPYYGTNVYSYIYHEGTFDSDEFTLQILDEEDNVMTEKNFSFLVQDNVEDRTYTKGQGLDNILTIPYVDFLDSYYLNLDRIYKEDYASFVFDKYDETYIDLVLDLIIKTFAFGEDRFDMRTDVQRVEYVASFVQNLAYKPDSTVDEDYEYPRFPVETLFNGAGGGDCEDKAILTASLLNNLGFETALFRLPNHMAVGVKLAENEVPGDYYVQDYDFLETTTPGNKCGDISDEGYENLDDLTVYPIEDRAYLIHNWKDGVITTYTNTMDGDIIKAVAYTSNLGNKTAKNIVVEGLFFVENTNLEYKKEQLIIPELKPGDTKKTIITCSIPNVLKTKFKTRVYLDGEVSDTEESKGYFP